LSYNNIDNEGARSLAHALETKNCQVRELRIQGNNISQDGMIEIFRSKNLLKILDISENVTQIGILHSFRNFIEQNTEINALSISGLQNFNDRAFKSIISSLKENRSL
jgi:Ran GTPase-activating protein (RanGAP) involved in mRNA processing and transport